MPAHPARVYREVELPCSADAAWAEVQKLSLLEEISRPLITFKPGRGDAALPENLEPGDSFRIRSYLYGVVPLGERLITLVSVDPAAREIRTRETDPLIRRWDHTIRVRDAGEGRALYSDEILIDAGPLTPAVVAFARYFYRHRQRRWLDVARRLSQR